MVRQVNRYFVCDTVAELDNIRFNDLEGTKAFIKSSPTEEYIYTAGNWQLIAGGVIVEGLEDKLDIPTGTPTGSKFLRDDNSWQTVPGGGGGGTSNSYFPSGWG